MWTTTFIPNTVTEFRPNHFVVLRPVNEKPSVDLTEWPTPGPTPSCSTPLSTGQKTPGPWDEVSAVLVSDDLMTCKEQSRCAKLRAEAAVEFDTVVNDIGLTVEAGVSDSQFNKLQGYVM